MKGVIFSNGRNTEGVSFVHGRYTKGISFLPKMVYKRVRGRTSGWSFPFLNFFSTLPSWGADIRGRGMPDEALLRISAWEAV